MSRQKGLPRHPNGYTLDDDFETAFQKLTKAYTEIEHLKGAVRTLEEKLCTNDLSEQSRTEQVPLVSSPNYHEDAEKAFGRSA